MLERVRHIQWMRGARVVGLQISMHKPGEWEYHLVQIQRKRKLVFVWSAQMAISSLDGIKMEVGNQVPVVIALDGKGVFHKEFDESPGENPMNKVLPNARAADFYVQTAQIGSAYWVSVIRKDTVRQVLALCKEHKLPVAGITLGPFSLVAIMDTLLQGKASFNTEFWNLDMSRERMLSPQTEIGSTEYVEMDTDKVPGVCMPVYALGIGYLFSLDTPELPVSGALQEAFLFKRAIRLWGWILLILVFGVLLVNFFVFSHYNSKYNEASQALQQQSSALRQAEELQNKYQSKRQFIERSGLLNGSFMSFYADRIARLVPDSLQLTYLHVYPLQQKLRKSKPVKYLDNAIEVGGKCAHSRYFNQWKEKLKKRTWVDDIYIHSFGQEQEGEPIMFEVLIKLKIDE